MKKTLLLIIALFLAQNLLFGQDLMIDHTGDILPIKFYQSFKGNTYSISGEKDTYIFHFTNKYVLAYYLDENSDLQLGALFSVDFNTKDANYLGGLSKGQKYSLFFKSDKSFKAVIFDFKSKDFQIKDYEKLVKGEHFMGSIADEKNIYFLTQVRKTKELMLHQFDEKFLHQSSVLDPTEAEVYVGGSKSITPERDFKIAQESILRKTGKNKEVKSIMDHIPTPIGNVTHDAKMYIEDDFLLLSFQAYGYRTILWKINRLNLSHNLNIFKFPKIDGFKQIGMNRSNSFYRDQKIYLMIANEQNVGITGLNLDDSSIDFQITFNQNEEKEDYYLRDLELPEGEKSKRKELNLKRSLRRIVKSDFAGIKVLELEDKRFITLGGYTEKKRGGVPMPGIPLGGIPIAGGGALTFNFSITLGAPTTFERSLSIDLIHDKSSQFSQLKEYEEPFEGMARYLENHKSNWDFRFIHQGRYILGYFNKKSKSLQFREFKLR